jgi:pilus assembly protein FimV
VRDLMRVLLLAASAATAVAADEAPPSLRLTYQLSPQRAGANERAVLRLERLAATSAAREQAVIGELLERVHRADTTMDEIRRLLLTLPERPPESPATPAKSTAPTPPPAPVASPAPAVQPAEPAAEPSAPEPASDAASDSGEAAVLAVAAALLAAIGAWLGWQRWRRHTDETEIAATVMMPGREAWQPEPATDDTTMANWPPEPNPMTDPTTETGETAHRTADTMIAIGLNESAARSLENHIRSHPRRALSHWLRLLDLYRNSGLRAEFDQAAERLNRQYNVALVDWQVPANDEIQDSLERFPHVRARLVALWPGDESVAYLQHLLDDNRDGTRLGFSRAVTDEILLLQTVLRERQAGLSMSMN